jgi:hypothetical protein
MTRQHPPWHRNGTDTASPPTTQHSTATCFRERCHVNGCTDDERAVWQSDEGSNDQRLIGAAAPLYQEHGVLPLGSVTERIDGGRVVLFDGTRAGLRPYLDELSGVIYTVARPVVYAEDMRELIADHRLGLMIRGRRGGQTPDANRRSA